MDSAEPAPGTACPVASGQESAEEPRPPSLSPLAAAVLASSLDAIVVMDAQGVVVEWNPAAEAMFGYAAERAVGTDLAQLIIPEGLRGAHRRALARQVDPPVLVGVLGRRLEVEGQRADGTVFPVELTITATMMDGRTVFTGFLRDNTRRLAMLRELRDSSARLVEVADQARRTLQRDLHDGAQQQLVAVSLTLSAARDASAADPRLVVGLIDQAAARLAAGIDQLRELARGIHPAALEERGLAAAVNELARRSPIPVVVQVDAPVSMPMAVQAALYFVCAETLTNAAKHGARTASVTVTQHYRPGSRLTPTLVVGCAVSDDGPGGAAPSAGSGLAGLRDRLAAVGGHLEIESPPGPGTTVRAVIDIDDEVDRSQA